MLVGRETVTINICWQRHNLIKKKIKCSSYIRKFRMEQLQGHIWLTACAFPHILGSPFSYMTLQLLHFEFPYIWGKFDFHFYQCTHLRDSVTTILACKNLILQPPLGIDKFWASANFLFGTFDLSLFDIFLKLLFYIAEKRWAIRKRLSSLNI